MNFSIKCLSVNLAVVPREGFNQQLYHGFWYELERYDDNPVTLFGSDCNTASFSSSVDGSTRITNEARLNGVQWSAFFFYLMTNTLIQCISSKSRQQMASARVAHPAEDDDSIVPAIWNVTFDGLDGADGGGIQLIILSTDYINYSLVYSCDELTDNRHNEGFWFLSRSPGMPTRNPATIARSWFWNLLLIIYFFTK